MFKIDYTVKRIDGDYAILITDGGDETPVARALLPEDIAEGDRLVCEDFVYRVL